MTQPKDRFPFVDKDASKIQDFGFRVGRKRQGHLRITLGRPVLRNVRPSLVNPPRNQKTDFCGARKEKAGQVARFQVL
jgi:hypothetical protein